jgi:hypothetical protein
VATTSISLIREQSEAVCPPRALWVPFALGRPFGSADDPEFQKQVLRAAFAMLATATKPTIEDYPIEAPAEADAGQWVCPVNFPVTQSESITARLVAEVTRLAPWSAETRSARGRTLFGVTGAAPDQIEAVARAFGGIADSGDLIELPNEGVEWKFDMPLLVRHLADDLRTFYHEGIAAQPGPGAPNHDALNDWIFGSTAAGGTALGEALQTIAGHLTEQNTPFSLLVRGLLIPEGYWQGGSAFPTDGTKPSR